MGTETEAELSCRACESKRVVSGVPLAPQRQGGAALLVHTDPDGILFKGTKMFNLQARVCGDCGYTEFYAPEHADLYLLHTEVMEHVEASLERERLRADPSIEGRLTLQDNKGMTGGLTSPGPLEKCTECGTEREPGYEVCWKCESPYPPK